MHKKTIIIVHPFTSEKHLYKTVKERGYTIITLITPFDHNWIKLCMDTVNKHSDFILNVTANVVMDLVAIKKLITDNQLELAAVINAFDYSLEYSDILTNELLNANINLKYSKIRCNKFDVNEELAKNSNIPVIKSILIENELNWQDGLGSKLLDFKYPVIIKPASESASKTNMSFADNLHEVEKYLAILFTKHSFFFDRVHSSFIIQEYIEGAEEFFVNTVAVNYQHKLTGVFKNQTGKNRFLGQISVTKDDAVIGQKVIDYHNQCMQHLQFSYGTAHAEYIIDKKTGQPYLLEINNRLAGIELPYLSNECYHTDEVNIFLDLIENKKEITEFDFAKIYSYSAIPFYCNYTNPDATHLDLASIKSRCELVVFRPGVIIAANKENGVAFDKNSAAIRLYNNNYAELCEDLEHLRDLETSGKLFVS